MPVNVHGSLIRTLRLQKSWSQDALAEKAGVSLRTVQRMEVEGVASLQSRRTVAEALGVSALDLAPPADKSSVDWSPAAFFSKAGLAALATFFAAGAIVATGAIFWLTHRDEGPVQVQDFVATVTYGDVAGPIRARGALWPRDVDTVHIDAVGRAVELRVELADYVEEGQVLAVVDGAEIAAPMSGTVISLEPMDGSVVGGVQTAPLVMEIADFDAMTVVAEIPETEIVALDLRTEVYITTLGSDRRWNGNLRRIDPLPRTDSGVVLYQANVEVANSESELYPAMTAQVFFETGTAENVLIVPLSALKFATAPDNAGARVVEIVLPDGTTEPRTIVVGAIDSVNAEVISGLDEGERVVARRT